VKRFIALCLPLFLLGGCATSSIDTRRKERAASYASLSPDLKQLVDQGQIKIGMTMDAVYIAWGRPAEELRSESEQGASITWLYHGSWLQETRYWSYRGGRRYGSAHLEHYYDPRDYVSAEIIFVNGVVKSWRTLPQPAY